MTATLIDHLIEQGYEPQEANGAFQRANGDWYDLIVSGIGTVRLVHFFDDGPRADVYVFDGGMVCEWDAKFSPGTPDAAIVAVIEAAEWQLAAKRGGPVTPAQAEVAR